MTADEVKTQLEAALPDAPFRLVRDTLLLENSSYLVPVAEFLKHAFHYDYLASLTAADYLRYLEAVYHFCSLKKNTPPFVLRVRTADRTTPRIPSLVPVYRGAEFQEREAYDTFGIVFEGHPDLRRIFLWDGFEGFPLRKDYRQEDSDTLELSDIEWLESRGIRVPSEAKNKAEELAREGKRAVAEKPEKPDA